MLSCAIVHCIHDPGGLPTLLHMHVLQHLRSGVVIQSKRTEECDAIMSDSAMVFSSGILTRSCVVVDSCGGWTGASECMLSFLGSSLMSPA